MLNHQGLQLSRPIENITALLDSLERANIKHPHEHNHNAIKGTISSTYKEPDIL